MVNPRLMGELIEHYAHRRWLKSKNFVTFIDVGAFIGSSCFAVSTILPNIWMFAFEPLKNNFDALVRNMNKRDRFWAYQVALGNVSSEGQIYQNIFSASSSILELDHEHLRQYPYAAKVNPQKVRIAKLDDFLPEMKIQPPALLKIDVQGYELEVLQGAIKTLEKVDSVFMEASFLPLYKNQCSYESIQSFMHKQGFQFKGTYCHQFTRTGDLIQADVLFCR